MRLLIAYTPVPSYLSCVLMAIRSSKSKSTDIFPIFRESYLSDHEIIRVGLTKIRQKFDTNTSINISIP